MTITVPSGGTNALPPLRRDGNVAPVGAPVVVWQIGPFYAWPAGTTLTAGGFLELAAGVSDDEQYGPLTAPAGWQWVSFLSAREQVYAALDTQDPFAALSEALRLLVVDATVDSTAGRVGQAIVAYSLESDVGHGDGGSADILPAGSCIVLGLPAVPQAPDTVSMSVELVDGAGVTVAVEHDVTFYLESWMATSDPQHAWSPEHAGLLRRPVPSSSPSFAAATQGWRVLTSAFVMAPDPEP